MPEYMNLFNGESSTPRDFDKIVEIFDWSKYYKLDSSSKNLREAFT